MRLRVFAEHQKLLFLAPTPIIYLFLKIDSIMIDNKINKKIGDQNYLRKLNRLSEEAMEKEILELLK